MISLLSSPTSLKSGATLEGNESYFVYPLNR